MHDRYYIYVIKSSLELQKNVKKRKWGEEKIQKGSYLGRGRAASAEKALSFDGIRLL